MFAAITGDLVSCSSDQSIIIWENGDNMWMEKNRFGTIGGQIPGGFGAKFNLDYVAVCGYQGAIQIWKHVQVCTIIKILCTYLLTSKA